MICNAKDLLSAFNVTSFNDFAKHLYKHSESGASVSDVSPYKSVIGHKKEVWRVMFSPSIVGVHAVKVRRNGRRSAPRSSVPEYVKQYLCAGSKWNERGDVEFEWSQVENFKAGENGITRVTKRFARVFVTFEVDSPVYRNNNGGIAIGSIIEGEDVEIPDTELLYPFSKDDVYRLVNDVDAMVNDWISEHITD